VAWAGGGQAVAARNISPAQQHKLRNIGIRAHWRDARAVYFNRAHCFLRIMRARQHREMTGGDKRHQLSAYLYEGVASICHSSIACSIGG